MVGHDDPDSQPANQGAAMTKWTMTKARRGRIEAAAVVAVDGDLDKAGAFATVTRIVIDEGFSKQYAEQEVVDLLRVWIMGDTRQLRWLGAVCLRDVWLSMRELRSGARHLTNGLRLLGVGEKTDSL